MFFLRLTVYIAIHLLHLFTWTLIFIHIYIYKYFYYFFYRCDVYILIGHLRGRQEAYCRFCDVALPDWRDTLAPLLGDRFANVSVPSAVRFG
jgi:hypothetical protein